MSPEEPLNETSPAGISRRRMLKRIGAGAAVAWTAPILTSIRTPAFAASPRTCTGESCGCDLGTPCNFAIDCHNSGGACNCWVLADASACYCGVFDSCSNHQPCASNADCPSGQCCITNCCGSLCYLPCGGRSGRRPSGNARHYGVTRL
jgi:transcription elongation factor